MAVKFSEKNKRLYKSVSSYFPLSYYIFKENDCYIAYCPALDLTTSGKTIKQAQKNFKECFELFSEGANQCFEVNERLRPYRKIKYLHR